MRRGPFATVADELSPKYACATPIHRRVWWRPRVSGSDQTWVSVRAQRVVVERAGPSANARELAAAAQRTYDELVRVAAPLIGQEGVEALIRRAVHLARPQFPWLTAAHAEPPTHDDDTFAHVARCLEQAEAGTAADAAGAVFGQAAGVLAALIGEGLTASLLYKAWPDAFPLPAKRSEHE